MTANWSSKPVENTKRLNKALWNNIMRLKLMNKPDATTRFVLEKSPFSDFDEEELDSGTYTEQDEYLIIGQIFPKSEIYKDGLIKIEMIVTSQYPEEPPRVRFLTPVYHPNIEEDGTFCHQLISHKSRWVRATTLVDVVGAVVKHLDVPDPDYAVTYDVGQEYVKNRAEFERKAKASVQPYLVPQQNAEPPNTANDPIELVDSPDDSELVEGPVPTVLDTELKNDDNSQTNDNDASANHTEETPLENAQKSSWTIPLLSDCTVS